MSEERRGEELDAHVLRELFQEISDRLEVRDEQAQLFVVGGAAMALEYDGGRVTRDVDALFVPTSTVRELAEELAEAHGFEPDWINDAAKGFLPGADEAPRTVFESESLLVQVPSPEYLLAMKLYAARDERDLNDAATLYNIAGFTTAEHGRELLARTYPQPLLLPRHRYVVEDVAGRAAVQRQFPDEIPPAPALRSPALKITRDDEARRTTAVEDDRAPLQRIRDALAEEREHYVSRPPEGPRPDRGPGRGMIR